MQNSLDRLLSGIAGALTDVVAPAIEDPYARTQARTAAELIENLRTRVTWQRGYELGWTVRCRDAAREAGRLGMPDGSAARTALALGEPETVSDDAEAMETYALTHLELLAALIAWAPSGPAPFEAMVREIADLQFSEEVARLRRA